MSKLYPLDNNQATLISIFNTNSLPNRPYCSDDLAQGIYPRLQHIAITKKYIQLNPPQMQHWLVFDIDRPDSAFCWDDCGLPPPFAVVVNTENTHCHVIYQLAMPVCTSDFAHQKPLKYLAAIQYAYTQKLKADLNYSGLIAKNPFSNKFWHVIPVAIEARYELSELEQWVSLTGVSKLHEKASEAVALGRNCSLFDSLRKFSYQEIRKFRTGKIDTWRVHILEKTMELNIFPEPLPQSEVKAIAKSVANWVWKNMRQDSTQFKQRQSARGRKGGKAKGRANFNKRVAAEVLRAEGYTQKETAEALGVTQQTIANWQQDFNDLFQST